MAARGSARAVAGTLDGASATSHEGVRGAAARGGDTIPPSRGGSPAMHRRALILALAALVVLNVTPPPVSVAPAWAAAPDAASQRNRAAAFLDNGEDAKAIEAF